MVGVWDLAHPATVRQVEVVGWDRLGMRAIDRQGRVLVQMLVGRSRGSFQLEVPPAVTLRLSVGFERSDGFFVTLVRSGAVRTPTEQPATGEQPCETVVVPPRLDRRLLLLAEYPARGGQRVPGAISPGRRLYLRLRMAFEAAASGIHDADLRPFKALAPPGSDGAPSEPVRTNVRFDPATGIPDDAVEHPPGWLPPVAFDVRSDISSPRHWVEGESQGGSSWWSGAAGGRPGPGGGIVG